MSIGERAEAIAQLYEDRRISTQQALADFDRLTQEYVQADAERRRLGIDENAFAIYTMLKAVVPTATAEQAQALNALFVRYPDYGWNTQHAGSLRTELYKAVRTLAGPDQMIARTNALMNRRIRHCPRTGPPDRPQPRQGLQEFHAGLSARLGGTRTAVAQLPQGRGRDR